MGNEDLIPSNNGNQEKFSSEEFKENQDGHFDHPNEVSVSKRSLELKPISNSNGEQVQSNDNAFQKDLFAIPFEAMLERVKTRPQEKLIWGNIKENSIGLIIGPSGAGKSILSENLAMSLACGSAEYLGIPIVLDKKNTILSISLEENCDPRTERNESQMARIVAKYGNEWMKQWFVVDERMPQYLSTEQDFDIIRNLIDQLNPNIVIIDSLTHLCSGQIEDSSVSSKLMSRIRSLVKGKSCTMIIIHHTPKINDAPLTIQSVAGSRVVGQEVDFIIGINSLSNGKKYLKMVKSRYKKNSTSVIQFNIDDDCWLKPIVEMDEQEILATVDGRFDSANKDKLLQFIQVYLNDHAEIEFSVIRQHFVENDEMSLQTAHTQLNVLVKEGKIRKEGHGRYKN